MNKFRYRVGPDRYPDGLSFAADLELGCSGEQPLAGKKKAALRRVAGVLLLSGVALGVGLVANRSAPVASNPAPTPVVATDPPESTADRRLRQNLEQALQDLLRRERSGSDALARLAPQVRSTPRLHPRLRAAQATLASRVAAEVKAKRPVLELVTTLDFLADLQRALPVGAPSFQGATTMANEVVGACASVFSTNPREALSALEALKHCRVRTNDPIAATDLFNSFLSGLGLRRDPEAIQIGKRLILTCAKLDLGTGGHEARNGQLFRPFSPTGTDPWSTYVRARCTKSTKAVRTVLRRFLEHPPAGFELGPVHWAETARHIARSFAPEVRLRLLREASRRDPRSYIVQGELSDALRDAKRFQAALAPADRSRELFEQLGFVARDGLRSEWEILLARRVRILVECKQRDRAREAFRELIKTFPPRDAVNASKKLKKKHPWLAE